jgi:hypothetical protein
VSTKTSVVVVNETDAPLTLRLYAADAYTSSSGAFTLQPPFKPKHHMGAWIQLPVDKITVAPRSGDIVPFTYNPPPDVASGDYAGGIVAEQTNGAVTKRGTVRISALEAVGSAVFGRVQGPINPRLAVSAVSVGTISSLATEFGGSVDAKVTYSVTNTGNKNLNPDVTVSLKPLFGSGPATEHVKLPQVLPGSTVTFTHTFHSVEAFGRLTATVVAHASGAEASGSSSTLVIPWALVAIVVILLLIIILRWRRRRNRRRPAPIDEPDPDPDGAQNGVEAMAASSGKAKTQDP